MLSRFLWTIVWVIVLGASVTSSSFAQQPMIADAQFHAQTIHEVQAVAQNWRWQAELQIAFVVAVIVFGALITIIQGVNRSWCKTATLVLGACTTILTAVNARVFSADYRVLQESAIDADQMIDQLDTFLRLEAMPGADVNGLEKQILGTTTQFRALQRAVATGKTAPAATGAQGASFSFWASTVYAQSIVPSWVTEPPTDRYNLYFVGVGEDRSTSVAEHRSFDSAVAAGVKALSVGGNTDINRLRSFIASSSLVENRYLTFDEKNGVYRFYTLLQISNDIRKLDFSAARNENPCSAVTINERTWQRFELPGGGGTVTLALWNLYRISRGSEGSHLYIIDSSSVYTGTSGKFDEKANALPADLTKEFRFSGVKDFPPFKIHGAAYNLSITGVDHNCVTSGCQKLTMKLCRAAD